MTGQQPTRTTPAPIVLQGLRRDARGAYWIDKGGLLESTVDGDTRTLEELERGPYGPTREVVVGDAMLAAHHDRRAKAAVDAYRAGPTAAPAAPAAIALLAEGLYERQVTRAIGYGLDRDIVRIALAHIDAQRTALAEAARSAEPGGGLSALQEIRARALDAAIEFGHDVEVNDDETADDHRDWVLDTASEFASFIRDGDVPDDGEVQWGGAHRDHFARFLEHRADCGCRWTPPPITDDSPEETNDAD